MTTKQILEILTQLQKKAAASNRKIERETNSCELAFEQGRLQAYLEAIALIEES